jgi:hypothetical protein
MGRRKATWRDLKSVIQLETFTRHFLTVVRDGAVLDSGGNPVTTKKFMRNRLLDDSVVSGYLQVHRITAGSLANVRTLTGSQRTSPVGAPDFILDSCLAGVNDNATSTHRFLDHELLHQFHPRIHYRIVFKEVCTPMHEVKNMLQAFDMLHDIVKGLFYHLLRPIPL